MFTKEDRRQMPGTDINFPRVEGEILKKIRIMSDQVIEKLELLKTEKLYSQISSTKNNE